MCLAWLSEIQMHIKMPFAWYRPYWTFGLAYVRISMQLPFWATRPFIALLSYTSFWISWFYLCIIFLQDYQDEPFCFKFGKKKVTVNYCPGESDCHMFGGNSNWRGPIWLCSKYPPIKKVWYVFVTRQIASWKDDWQKQQLFNLKFTPSPKTFFNQKRAPCTIVQRIILCHKNIVQGHTLANFPSLK